MITSKSCLNCKITFETKNSARKFCSAKCSNTYWIRQNRGEFGIARKIIKELTNAMVEAGLTHSDIAKRIKKSCANVAFFLSDRDGMSTRTIDELTKAIGGQWEIKLIRNKTENELLREQIESLKAQLEAKK